MVKVYFIFCFFIFCGIQMSRKNSRKKIYSRNKPLHQASLEVFYARALKRPGWTNQFDSQRADQSWGARYSQIKTADNKKIYTINVKSPIYEGIIGIFRDNYDPISPLKEFLSNRRNIQVVSIHQLIRYKKRIRMSSIIRRSQVIAIEEWYSLRISLRKSNESFDRPKILAAQIQVKCDSWLPDPNDTLCGIL